MQRCIRSGGYGRAELSNPRKYCYPGPDRANDASGIAMRSDEPWLSVRTHPRLKKAGVAGSDATSQLTSGTRRALAQEGWDDATTSGPCQPIGQRCTSTDAITKWEATRSGACVELQARTMHRCCWFHSRTVALTRSSIAALPLCHCLPTEPERQPSIKPPSRGLASPSSARLNATTTR